MNLFAEHEPTRVGFSGTRRGLTEKQQGCLRWALAALALDGEHRGGWELHHGACEGADEWVVAQAAALARGRPLIVAHPGDTPAYTSADAVRLSDEVRPARGNLERNLVIVQTCPVMVTAPNTAIEQPRGSGTWATIRYARRADRHLMIVAPDGTAVHPTRLSKLGPLGKST